MIRILLTVILLSQTCFAGPFQDRFIQRGREAIGAVPCNAVGASYSRQIRFNAIPIMPPLGVFGIGGRAVTFDQNLSHPRISRILGGGLTATIGIGFPYSIGSHQEVRIFRNVNDRERFVQNRHFVGSATLYGAVGLPGRLFLVERGPHWDTRPGQVVWKKDRFLGLFASAGGQVGTTMQWSHHLRK